VKSHLESCIATYGEEVVTSVAEIEP